MISFRRFFAVPVFAAALSASGVTVTTPAELLQAAAAVPSSGGEIVMASPNGVYPVTYKMTASVLVDGLGSYNKFTLRGATGNRDDVILDFSQTSGYGVRLVGHYYGTATAHSFTIQNATNLSASPTIGGGLMVEEGFVSNVVVRNCYAGTPSGTTGEPHGGGINMSGRFGICDSVISNCAAVAGYYEAGGGGVWVRNSGVLDHTLITNCYVKGGNKGYGGGFGGGVGYTFKHSKIVDCHVLKGTSEAFGGGVRVTGQSRSIITNCLFAGNTCVGSGGAFYLAYTSANNPVSDSTFVDNSCNGEGGAVSIQYANVRNCKFLRNRAGTGEAGMGGAAKIGNGGTLENCLFKDNSAAWGGGAWGSFTKVKDCVFEGNVCSCATSGDASGSGALYIGAARWSSMSEGRISNARIEECIFRGNTNVLCTYDVLAGAAITIRPVSCQTNVVIRHCYFDRNHGGFGTIRIDSLDSTKYNPTFDNGYGVNIESCTFNASTPISTAFSIIRTVEPSVFVRNCHFTGSSGFKAVNFSAANAHHVQYCVADADMTGLPTDKYLHNSFGRRILDLGENRNWMFGAKDMGDGSYTLGTSADWGVTVRFNNRIPRICFDRVDVGCFERKRGLVVYVY